jgi:hypothetical protein
VLIGGSVTLAADLSESSRIERSCARLAARLVIREPSKGLGRVKTKR